MKLRTVLILLSLCFLMKLNSKNDKTVQLKILQLNLWHGTTAVPNGFDGTVSVIEQTDPDIALLCEANDNDLINRLLEKLNSDGVKYYGHTTNKSPSIISKFPMDSFEYSCDPGDRPIIKSVVDVAGQTIVLYSAHLDYTHYECYMPRGYSGTSWKKLDAKINDADSVLYYNKMSKRDESIVAFIDDSKKEINKGNIVILGGDFNEPSHLDWQADTKNLRDHNGLVINWDCSVMLEETGFKDAFRQVYPNPVNNPGFTFPSANKDAPISKLTWAPEADERDRIDFVYYYPNSALKLVDTKLVGPSATIKRSQQVENESKDKFIEPINVWPTDHKGNLVVFKLKSKK